MAAAGDAPAAAAPFLFFAMTGSGPGALKKVWQVVHIGLNLQKMDRHTEQT